MAESLEYERRGEGLRRISPAGPVLLLILAFAVALPFVTFLIGEAVLERGWAYATVGDDLPGMVVVASAAIAVIHVVPFAIGAVWGNLVMRRLLAGRSFFVLVPGLLVVVQVHVLATLVVTSSVWQDGFVLAALALSALLGWICVRLGEA